MKRDDIFADDEVILDDYNLFKSTKDHHDKKMNELLESISKQNGIYDPLKKIGNKYKQRHIQFQRIKNEKNQLLLQTRKLQDEIQKLKKSTKRQGNNLFSDMPISYHNSTNETYKYQDLHQKNTLQQVEKLLNKTRKIQFEQTQQYNNLIQSLLKFAEQRLNYNKLIQQTKKSLNFGESMQDMISVPRKRYLQLIQIYSLNMSEISARQLQNKLNPSYSVRINNFINQSQNRYKQNYTNLITDRQFNIKDMHLFFYKFTQKFGLEKVWERYHSQNKDQAIRLKNQLDKIIQPLEINSNPLEQKKQIKQSYKDQILFLKIQKIMKTLNFTNSQKNQFQKIRKSFRDDYLIRMSNISSLLHKNIDKQKTKNIKLITDIIQNTAVTCFNTFIKSIKTSLTKSSISLNLQEYFSKQTIEKHMNSFYLSEDFGLSAAQSMIIKIRDKMVEILSKKLVYVSGDLLLKYKKNK